MIDMSHVCNITVFIIVFHTCMKSASSNIHPRLDVQILAEVHSGGIGAKSASTGDAAACQSCRAV